MIILKTKTFGSRDPKKVLNGVLKGYMREEDRKKHGRPSREESRQNRLKHRIQELDDKTEKLRDKVVEKTKEITSNPKFKKNAKIVGLATLGTGLTAGTIIGGIKLKKKIDEKKKNEAIKKQVADEE